MDSPTPNTPLSQDDVKLLRKGDWLLHESLGPCTVVDGGPAFLEVAFPSRRQTSEAWAERRFTFLGRPDQSGWIPHDGGPNPAPGLRVDVKLTDGSVVADVPPQNVRWDRKGIHMRDITHWRPHVPTPAGEDHGIKGILGVPVRESNDTPIDWAADEAELEGDFEMHSPSKGEPGYATPQPKGEVEAAVERDAIDPLRETTARFRTRLHALQAGKREVNAGRPAPSPCPIYAMLNDLPSLLKGLEAAEFEIEAAFEEYEDHLTASQAREARAAEALEEAVAKADWLDGFSATSNMEREAVKLVVEPIRATLQSLKEQTP